MTASMAAQSLKIVVWFDRIATDAMPHDEGCRSSRAPDHAGDPSAAQFGAVAPRRADHGNRDVQEGRQR
jgi:hypothetical protein